MILRRKVRRQPGCVTDRGETAPRLRTALALVAWLLVVPEPVSSQDGGWSLEAVVSEVRVSGAAAAPDGGTVLATSDRSGRSKIWAMDADGANARLLVPDEGAEADPAWSADGTRVAFVRWGDTGTDIWAVSVDGAGLRRVTADPHGERAVVWSPDGECIAFLSDRSGHQDLFVVEVESGAITQLTEGAMPWDEPRFGAVWSPDGNKLAYVSNASGEWADDIWWVDVHTGVREKLTAGLHVMSTPAWSPDGTALAFNAVRAEEFWYGDQSDIYLLDVASRTARRVEMNTHASDGNGSVGVAWDPSGDRIYFRYLWQGDANLWAVSREGGVATQMTYEPGDFGMFSVAGDGSGIFYVRSTPTRAGELYRVDPSGGGPTRLTEWTEEWAQIGPPERTAFLSRDGTYILGYLFRPRDFDPSSEYPALVQVHGGGNNAFGNGFHALEQLLAHRGFVVLAIEYRGSAGHGRAFQDLALGDWAAGQGWDAVAAARWLEAQPWSNGRVGIYGGSYGGIMTLAALTRDSEPFDAAAPFRGIYDWADAYVHGDRLMRFWIIEGHGGFMPGEHPELFERTASIRHLDRVRRDLPFLVVHGELDRRAPYQQSQRLVEALRARGNAVEFHSYPEDGHGLSRASRRDAWGRMIEFFEKTLARPDPDRTSLP